MRSESAEIELIVPAPGVDARLRTVVAYIGDNLSGKLTRKEVARQVGLRESYIAEYFKACSGLSLRAYIRLARLAKARDLLRTSFLSVKEISSAVGFTQESNFDRAFKHMSGMSPLAYRRRFRRR